MKEGEQPVLLYHSAPHVSCQTGKKEEEANESGGIERGRYELYRACVCRHICVRLRLPSLSVSLLHLANACDKNRQRERKAFLAVVPFGGCAHCTLNTLNTALPLFPFSVALALGPLSSYSSYIQPAVAELKGAR